MPRCSSYANKCQLDRASAAVKADRDRTLGCTLVTDPRIKRQAYPRRKSFKSGRPFDLGTLAPSSLVAGSCAPLFPPIGLTAAGVFAGGEVSRDNSRVRSPGTLTCARCPAGRSALDAGPEAYHNPAASLVGAFAVSAVIWDRLGIIEPGSGSPRKRTWPGVSPGGFRDGGRTKVHGGDSTGAERLGTGSGAEARGRKP